MNATTGIRASSDFKARTVELVRRGEAIVLTRQPSKGRLPMIGALTRGRCESTQSCSSHNTYQTTLHPQRKKDSTTDKINLLRIVMEELPSHFGTSTTPRQFERFI